MTPFSLLRLVSLAAICWVAIPAVCCASDWPQEPPAPDIDDAQFAQLMAGEVLVENTLLDESGGAAYVLAVFHAPVASVWDLLGNCEANYRFVDGLRGCRVEESTPERALSWQAVKKHFFSPRMEYRFETARLPGKWVAIRLVSGDLKELNGSWRFDPLDEPGTMLVSHRIQIQPSFPVPRWLVQRTLRNDVGDMVACLRSIAGGSGDNRQLAADGKRCPKKPQKPPG